MILKRFYSNPLKIDIRFQNGLNLICADVSKKSSKKSTRNGAGKSTLLKLIDFCLLSDLDKKIEDCEEFQKYEFILELENEGIPYLIKRSIKRSVKTTGKAIKNIKHSKEIDRLIRVAEKYGGKSVGETIASFGKKTEARSFIKSELPIKNKKAAKEFFKGAKSVEDISISKTKKGYTFEYFDPPGSKTGPGPGKFYKLETDSSGKIINRYRYGLNKEGKVIEDTYEYLLGEKVYYSYKG
jgi:hypothetical protein